jgi:hypothetical protein
MERANLEPVAYWSHLIVGLLGALFFVPYLGVFWMAMLWPAQLVPAAIAIVSGFFFWPSAILSLLLLSLLILLMLPEMVSSTIPDLMIAGYSMAAIVIFGYRRITRSRAKVR